MGTTYNITMGNNSINLMSEKFGMAKASFISNSVVFVREVDRIIEEYYEKGGSESSAFAQIVAVFRYSFEKDDMSE